ncbi:hypothetical protein K0M31_007473 [Melipona bicolor]|uniref:Uncharacterized protein n=1 Tax=Melipona bicolor TaxID=60889 RepID=A0AA40GBH7_9HYME|nr:hypothetical protein K0M31_007473 [Melipona bicolor]
MRRSDQKIPSKFMIERLLPSSMHHHVNRISRNHSQRIKKIKEITKRIKIYSGEARRVVKFARNPTQSLNTIQSLIALWFVRPRIGTTQCGKRSRQRTLHRSKDLGSMNEKLPRQQLRLHVPKHPQYAMHSTPLSKSVRSNLPQHSKSPKSDSDAPDIQRKRGRED